MIDPRIAEAQELHWRIHALREFGAHSATLRAWNRDAARIYEARARELLHSGDAHGWTDLFAAITHWGQAGDEGASTSLLELGDQVTATLSGDAADAIRAQLDDLRLWLRSLSVVPSLASYARSLPPLPKAA